ncbi:GGDEF domain-containing protein [Microbaculum marinum]|uniref:diguanylate cyclase n=1 Tax=Microbaculum marinum TaxID=1764581 RepID=A0AAW9RP57_9HYPH
MTMALVAPGVLCVFALAFLWAWTIEKTRHYLLLLAAGPFLFAVGALMQVFSFPDGTAPNALASGLFYTAAVLFVAEAVLWRSGKRLGVRTGLVLLAAVMGGLWYFAVIEPNTLVRVYIQNFGYGAIFLLAACKLVSLRRGRLVDRVLFWVLLVFALQFFFRTALTIGLDAPKSAAAFAESLFWAALHLSLAVLGTAFATALLAAAVSDLVEDLRRERDVDALTGVLNRRGFEVRARTIMTSGSRPLTLIACDLDHFKQINDSYGHGAGDEVLRAFGRLLGVSARPVDVVGRTGGEEFAILLHGGRDAAIVFAERLRVELSRMEYAFLRPETAVTASFGIAGAEPGDTMGSLLDRADRRLYLAKQGGRDRIIAADAEPAMRSIA